MGIVADFLAELQEKGIEFEGYDVHNYLQRKKGPDYILQLEQGLAAMGVFDKTPNGHYNSYTEEALLAVKARLEADIAAEAVMRTGGAGAQVAGAHLAQRGIIRDGDRDAGDRMRDMGSFMSAAALQGAHQAASVPGSTTVEFPSNISVPEGTGTLMLRQGARGWRSNDQARTLQGLLTDISHLTGDPSINPKGIDGYAGTNTEAAVRALETALDIDLTPDENNFCVDENFAVRLSAIKERLEQAQRERQGEECGSETWQLIAKHASNDLSSAEEAKLRVQIGAPAGSDLNAQVAQWVARQDLEHAIRTGEHAIDTDLRGGISGGNYDWGEMQGMYDRAVRDEDGIINFGTHLVPRDPNHQGLGRETVTAYDEAAVMTALKNHTKDGTLDCESLFAALKGDTEMARFEHETGGPGRTPRDGSSGTPSRGGQAPNSGSPGK